MRLPRAYSWDWRSPIIVGWASRSFVKLPNMTTLQTKVLAYAVEQMKIYKKDAPKWKISCVKFEEQKDPFLQMIFGNPRQNSFGRTNCRDKEIEFNVDLVGKYRSFRFWKGVVLHEIAHAIVGRGHGHDEVWAAKAEEIGSEVATVIPQGWARRYIDSVKAKTT